MSLQWVTEIPLLHSHLSTGERLSLYSKSINETILSDFYYLPAEQGEGGDNNSEPNAVLPMSFGLMK